MPYPAPKPWSGQFLTAVFELHPSRRKAALMERARAAAQTAFADIITSIGKDIESIRHIERMLSRADRFRAIIALVEPWARSRGELPSAVKDGLAKDLRAVISAFVEKRIKARADGRHTAARQVRWPASESPTNTATVTDFGAAIDDLAASFMEEDERDAAARCARVPAADICRPLTITRASECRLTQVEVDNPRGQKATRVGCVLMVSKPDWPEARVTTIKPSLDATNLRPLPTLKTASAIIVPVSLSSWHRHKFLNSGAVLRSAKLLRRGDRWFLAAAFEMPTAMPVAEHDDLGVDRGVRRGLVASRVTTKGTVREIVPLAEREIADQIEEALTRARKAQRRGNTNRERHRKRVQHVLRRAAKSPVRRARQNNARIVLEDLTAFKRAINAKRRKGARCKGSRSTLNKMQIGTFEREIEMRLKPAGLGSIIYVNARGTSKTCPCCGHEDRANRPSRGALFQCTGCRFHGDSDDVAATNIARRAAQWRDRQCIGVGLRGQTNRERNKDMVDRLWASDDRAGGLGPLAAGVARDFVADRNDGRTLYERDPQLRLDLGTARQGMKSERRNGEQSCRTSAKEVGKGGAQGSQLTLQFG